MGHCGRSLRFTVVLRALCELAVVLFCETSATGRKACGGFVKRTLVSLQWRHRHLDYFFNGLFWLTADKTSTFWKRGRLWGESTFPSSCAESVSTSCHPWWRHQMEIFSALLALCARNSPVTGDFPAQRPVTRSFDVFFDLRLNKRVE